MISSLDFIFNVLLKWRRCWLWFGYQPLIFQFVTVFLPFWNINIIITIITIIITIIIIINIWRWRKSWSSRSCTSLKTSQLRRNLDCSSPLGLASAPRAAGASKKLSDNTLSFNFFCAILLFDDKLCQMSMQRYGLAKAAVNCYSLELARRSVCLTDPKTWNF